MFQISGNESETLEIYWNLWIWGKAELIWKKNTIEVKLSKVSGKKNSNCRYRNKNRREMIRKYLGLIFWAKQIVRWDSVSWKVFFYVQGRSQNQKNQIQQQKRNLFPILWRRYSFCQEWANSRGRGNKPTNQTQEKSKWDFAGVNMQNSKWRRLILLAEREK